MIRDLYCGGRRRQNWVASLTQNNPNRVISNRPARWLIFLTCLVLGLGARAWDQRRFWTRYNFREVVPAQVYAGGFQSPATLRGVVKQFHIRTVVTLLP